MKTVLITGCARGIGKQLALDFAKNGWQVIATDLNALSLAQCQFEKQSPNIATLPLDVTDYAAWEKVLAHVSNTYGKLDVLVNNAGVMVARTTESVAQKEIDLQVDINVKGVMYGTTLAAPLMVRQGGGHIINVASIAGITPAPGLGVYCGSKFAVRGFTLSAAYDLREKGVYLTAICPDAVNTDMVKEHVHNQDAAMVFSAKLLTAADVSKAVFKALRTRKIEIYLPFWRGFTAKVAGFAPILGFWLKGIFIKMGRKRQGGSQS